MNHEFTPTKQALTPAFWSLPHEVRRAVWRALYPDRYREAQARRRDPVHHHSLHHFDRYHCCFVHVPKAAGTSLAHSLFGNPVYHDSLRNYSLFFDKREFRDYFKFTIVRNPWGRLYSTFSFLKAGGVNRIDRGWADANLAGIDDFETFVTQWLPRADVENSYIHFVPQYRFLRLQGDAPAVDFIGRFETLKEDFEKDPIAVEH